MADASQTPNPLEACLRDGRDEEFTKCLAALELCNRSLADYLETKRKKFPRFYFISSTDLVDVRGLFSIQGPVGVHAAPVQYPTPPLGRVTSAGPKIET